MPFLQDPDVTLYLEDAIEGLARLDPESVDAIITSPPYLDARDDVYSPHWAYGDWSARWLEHSLRVLTRSGSLMLNLGRLHRDGEELDYWVDVLGRARRLGFKWIDTIIWHKVNGGGGKGSVYLIDRHEYVLWLARSVDPYKGFDEARQPYSPATLARYTRRWAKGNAAVKNKIGQAQEGRQAHPDGAKPGSVFTSSVGAEKGIAHPTPMSLDLAEHLVKLACPPGGLLLDPFAGAGTTAVAARKLRRDAILFEHDPVHCAEIARRLSQQALPLEEPL